MDHSANILNQGSREMTIQELATSTEELNICREQLLAREEEIALLNAEQNNIMLLVEHLECRVSRYIPSLETTAGKWQAQSPDGMTNELEVLQALKSLFKHHKALDKKRTRDEDLAQVIELQDIIEKKSREQREMRDRLAALSAHVTELEKDLDTARKDLLKSKEANVKLQQDVREAMAQKEDMEKRITTLEKRYLAAQRKATSVHNLHDKLENEIANKDSMHRQKEDKDRQLQECLELAEQKLQQMLTEVVAELTPRVAVLSEAKQREKMNEEHNEHSSDTVDKLLSVSDERLQLHLKERMAALEDKVQPLKDQDRELKQQASMLANVGQLFKSDKGVSDGEGDRDTLFSMPALLSPSGPAVAKTLAMRIQEQLDKINEEIWFIQKDKENTDQRAEGIESRVGSGSFSNLRRFESSSSLNLDPASSHAGSFPPSRGRSMPERRQPSPEPEEDKGGFMTLLPAIQEEVEDDTIKCETSTSTSLRSFRLDRLTGSLRTASDEDIRDAHNATGSQDGPRGNPSNSNSSQKAPKKKGIKSSIGRWFGKKEKSRPGHTSKEALGPGNDRVHGEHISADSIVCDLNLKCVLIDTVPNSHILVDDFPAGQIAHSSGNLNSHKEDKDRQLQECLELAEQKLQQMLTEVVAELAQPVAALSKVQPLKDQDREVEQQASMLANVGQLFKSDKGVSDGEGDRVTLFSMPALLSPHSQADAKTPAGRIQKQLDRINEESWFIQRDKENTDQRAEGIESRVGSGSFSNLRRFNSSSSLNLDPASSHAGSFPPSRGRSMPKRRQPSPEQEEDKLGFLTLLPALQEEVEDDTIKCETSTSASLRSFRLDRLTGSLRIASDEDIRDARNATGSQAGPGGNPSKSNSSQDSLQKAPKKKGITSSTGRWFGKKEKGRPGHASKEALGPEVLTLEEFVGNIKEYKKGH
ncbi:hypothetical protein MJG53_012709 [Ovis ammon polii x Ovis aries]|uniref:Uncharacterized protein n=1 Tax=Ovis ammon polii x Ovis aries TaxID=2918886 RepID=A0ACB9ULN2_9CETA|nr:hypothetical protein MJG53_012709 [Ovis ammon polii x Ovis aries]